MKPDVAQHEVPGTAGSDGGPPGLSDATDSHGIRNLWDNSNIVESYNGITTPLTFSFARRAYEEVYRQFCRLLRVPNGVLADNDAVFKNMLGLIRGRVYYNLLNWYRALALLPGFSFNRRFMEQMMGVAEGLPQSIADELAETSWSARVRDGVRLAATSGSLVLAHFMLARCKRRFLERLDVALSAVGPDLSASTPDELAAYYRQLERRLLAHWDAPLVNDFLAMIASGLLRKYSVRWCGDSLGALHNVLLCGEPESLSAEPARRIEEMAKVARRDPLLMHDLCHGSPEEIERAIDRVPEFGELFESYLAKFGNRCLEELKLESRTLQEDPMVLVRSVGRLASAEADRTPRAHASDGKQGEVQTAADMRKHAEMQVALALRLRPVRRVLFAWMLRTARARVRDREILRFERTRVFARAREIFVALGRKLGEAGVLDDARDVFFLETEEILGFIEGTATCADLRGLAAVRAAEYEHFRQMEAPPRRFETVGPVLDSVLIPRTSAGEDTGEQQRQGLGCSPGVVRGRVRVVMDPRTVHFEAGDILVAERTDPGWIVLYSAAAGLVIERGSLLSHSMIVARELGIPAIASLQRATLWLKDGDWIELDGSRGLVTRINHP